MTQEKPNTVSVWVRNPMSIFLAICGIVEIGLTFGLVNVSEPLQGWLLGAMLAVFFPTFVFFAIVIWVRPENLYGPSDYQSDDSYIAVNKRVDKVESQTDELQRKLALFPTYSRLNKPAQCLFKAVYRPELVLQSLSSELRESADFQETLRWVKSTLSVSGAEVDDTLLEEAVRELLDIKWLEERDDSYEPTREGKDAYEFLSVYLYGVDFRL